MTVGGIDTYYDYDEQRWKYRRLGGGPVYADAPGPKPQDVKAEELPPASRRTRPVKRKKAEAV
ncbi:hypothetical protein [Kribbella sp. CA-247076]|uniref:hypothetical protein n=1 Tax=Kribbella sp. CA-247076 TaxID=3239941 RepID=UPI003D902ACF